MIRAVPLVGLGFPAFWIGIMLLLAFSLNSGRHFPVGGYGSGPFGHLHSMILPALTVALGPRSDPRPQPACEPARDLRVRLHRDGALERVARAAGADPPRLRNAIISTISVLAVSIGFLVGGTLIIEQVYALPGIGQLMINSILQRDFPVVQAVTLVFAIMVVLVYLLADILHAALDPRVRFD